MLKKNILTLVAATVLSLSALPALADSVSFGFTVGDRGGHHGGHRGGHHGGYRGGHHGGWGNHGYYRSHYRPYYAPHFYGSPAFYEAPYYQSTRVVYVDREPAPVYYQEEQPIVASKGRVVSNDPYCREYQRSVNVGGHMEQSYGTACRQPDGAWKVVSSD